MVDCQSDLRGEALERPDEHRELEVRRGDAMSGDLHAGAVQHRLPVDELRVPRLAEPRPSLGGSRLELEQVAAERPLEPGERRLDAVGGAPERRLAMAGRARVGVPPRPPLEQPAERE